MAIDDQNTRVAIAALKRRVDMMSARGTVTRAHDNKLQHLDVRLMPGEEPTGIEHFQSYGLNAVPLEGAEVLVQHLGGNRGHGIVTAFDDRRHRPQGLSPGEVALYAHKDQRVTLSNDGAVTVTIPGATVRLAPGGVITLTAATVRIEGNLSVSGDIENGGSMTTGGVHTDSIGGHV